MSGSERSAPSGRGRGALIAFLQNLSASETSSANREQTEEEAKSIGVLYSDSGIKASEPTPPSQRQIPCANPFHSAISVSSDGTPNLREDERPPVGPVGRARFFANRMQSSADSLPPMLARMQMKTASQIQSEYDEGHCSAAQTSAPSISSHETTQESQVVEKRGTSGQPISVFANYIRLSCDPKMGVFEYDVRFEPNIHSSNERYKLLNQHRETLGGQAKSFDGVTLYLPFRFPDSVTKLTSVNQSDNSPVSVIITYRRQQKVVECMHLYNVIFDRIMRVLQFVRYNRKNFDPTEPKVIPQHKLKIWPGYVTAVDEYEGGIMLCVDVTHRVLTQVTVLEKMIHAHASARGNITEFKANITKALLGSVVLTQYNNKSYRVDDIDFDRNPCSTFRGKDRDISYVEYYKVHYNIEIRDLKQPLLISRKEQRVEGKTEKETLTFCLIPELCNLSGISDDLRKDFKVMRDIATHTRITPNQRVHELDKFCKRVNNTPEAKAILTGWGLKLDNEPVLLNARYFGEETIIFGNNETVSASANADFNRACTSKQLINVVHLTNWLVIHANCDRRAAKVFVECMERNSRPMGISVASPQILVLNDDSIESYITALRKSLTPGIQVVVIICPTSRDDRYAAIKRICCAEIPVPSQVINARTLSNDAKNRGIVQKIALQMNCKMGGTLWSIKIPFDNVMICGIDSYHEIGGRDNSVSALVASLNNAYSRWFSSAVPQGKKDELFHGLVDSFCKALAAYKNVNGILPKQVIIYRDGVGDGQLKVCREHELPQFKKACQMVEPNYNPKFLFIVVQKRINTKIFLKSMNGVDNPPPGVIVDHTITRRYLYDFFMVPQNVRQGTVSPTHLIVVHDEIDLKVDIVQRLSYKLCFLYYNWPGTIRVPACCQYAHKLASLIGASVKRQSAEKLADKLFYL